MAAVNDEKRSDEAGSDPPIRDPGLAEGVTALAKAIGQKSEETGGSKFLKSFTDALITLFPSVVMFVLGFIFIQRVELDLKHQEFTASSADKLKTYVESLLTIPDAQAETTTRATALALGGFGSVAALPFISILDQGNEQQMDLVKMGLAQAGRISPHETCSIIASVIDDPTDAYKWQTRKAVTEVAGIAGCVEAREPLTRLDLTRPPLANLDPEQRTNFQTAINNALARIDGAEQRKPRWWSLNW